MNLKWGRVVIKYRDECVCCHSEMGCEGSSCLHKNIPYTVCDCCGDEAVVYSFSEEDVQMCKKCMELELDAEWKRLSFREKCEYFGVKEINI